MVVQLKVINTAILEYGIPTTESLGAAGYDLRACISAPVVVPVEDTIAVPTGIAIHIQDRNLAAFIFPRSGLAAKHHLTLQNSVGVIDSDYQGELVVLLRNESQIPYTVRPGDRIAQLVYMPVVHPMVSIVSSFHDETIRGTGGFGSTGVQSPSLHTEPTLGYEGRDTPTQSLGNDLPITPGTIEDVVVNYEPTGQELLEAEFGDD